MKSEVQEQIKEGCGLSWESYKLEGFVQKFSDTIFNFQEKVDDVLSYTDKIDGLVCSMETCEYKAKTFKVILEQIQKLIDDLNLRSYSNLSAWVKHLDNKVCTVPRTCMYRMAGNFRGKSEKALKINFCGFKFRDSNQSRAAQAMI